MGNYEQQGSHLREFCPHERGYWTSVPPQVPGFYWTSDLNGNVSVVELDEGRFYFMGSDDFARASKLTELATLWWSEMLRPPTP